jgi:5-methyltetrahydrofolate--homocysteine methyltransferase
MEELLQPIYDGIIDGDRERVKTGVQSALDAKMDPTTLLNQGMIAAMSEVGRRFEEGEYFIPEMLIAERAMKEGLAILRPFLVSAKVKTTGKVVIGTVQGDLHDIGKNLVSMMLEGAGFEMIDLGADVSPDKFLDAVRTHSPDLVAISALLTTTMPGMKTTIEAFKTAGLRDKVKIIIGGAPVSETYAAQIGADGYSSDANKAVALAKSLVA